MKLNDNEKALFDLLHGGQSVTLDYVVHKLGGSRKQWTVRIKYLAAKVAPEGYIIERTSGIGRGRKAVYIMTVKFKPNKRVAA